jgi:hypothetical protein
MIGVPGLGADQISNEAAERLDITVRVYTFTRVSAGDIATAELVATRIFRRTGVELTWVNCPETSPEAQQNPSCRGLNTPTEIFVRVVADFLENRDVSQSSMGYALPAAPPDRPYLAGISLVRARKQLLDGCELTLGELLGYGIAHEIGHLLLDTPGHTPSGLMCANWGAGELRLAGRGALSFSTQQKRAIRADVQARLRDQASQQHAPTVQMSRGGPSAPAPP